MSPRDYTCCVLLQCSEYRTCRELFRDALLANLRPVAYMLHTTATHALPAAPPPVAARKPGQRMQPHP